MTVKEVMEQMKEDISAVNKVYKELIGDLELEDSENKTGYDKNTSKISELKLEKERIITEIRAKYTKPQIIFLSNILKTKEDEKQNKCKARAENRKVCKRF